MKNTHPEPEPVDMPSEYDLSGKKGERGKYYQLYRKGHAVKITEADGSVTTQYFTLEEGAVLLEPDVRQYFPDSESVNKALRTLIELIPEKPLKKAAGPRRHKGSYKL